MGLVAQQRRAGTIWSRLLVAGLLLSASLALLDGCARESTPLGIGSLMGRVVDAETGQPVSGASVSAQGRKEAAVSGRSCVSDAEGLFRLEQLPAGPASVHVLAPGYEERTVPEVDVPSEAAAEVEVKLHASATASAWVSGTVRDVEGRLLSGVTVACGGSNTRTRADGAYRLPVTGASRATLVFDLPGYAADSRVVDTSSGSGSCDVSLERSDGASLTGRVIDAHDGEPIEGARVELQPAGLSSVTGAGGVYVFGAVAAGEWTLAVTARGFRAETRTIAIPAGTPAEALSLDVPLVAPRTGELRARVARADGGRPLAGVVVTTEPLGRSATTDAGGVAHIGHLPVGEYRLTLRCRDLGQSSVEGLTVDELRPAEITSEIAPTLAGLTGFLSTPTGGAIAESEIQVTGLPQGTLTLRTDAKGRFEAHDIFVGSARPTVRLRPSGGSASAHAVLEPGKVTDAGPLTLVQAGS